MKPFLFFGVAVALLACGFQANSQDLIVRTNLDSLNCKITSIDSLAIHFRVLNDGKRISSNLGSDQIINYVINYYHIRPANAGVINIFGDGAAISLNYERLFMMRKHFFMTAKIGLGYDEELQVVCFGGCDESEKFTIFSKHISGNFGIGRHFLEFGVGGSAISSSYDNNTYLMYPIIGYRFHPIKNHGFSARVYAIPVKIGKEPSGNMANAPIGVGLGYAFGR